MNWTERRERLRAIVEGKRCIFPASVYDGISARIAGDLGFEAMMFAGSVGSHGAMLGNAAISWANRMALLGVGDPGAAFEAVAWSMGQKDAPPEAAPRATWATRTPEIKDLLAFSVSDQYAEARTRLGLDR